VFNGSIYLGVKTSGVLFGHDYEPSGSEVKGIPFTGLESLLGFQEDEAAGISR